MSSQPLTAAPVQEDLPDLARFFKPRAMVVFGSVQMAPGHAERYRRFNCPVAFVNPKGGAAAPFPVYRTLAEVPGPLDLAMVRTSPKVSTDVLRECGERGIPFALVFSAGFSEVGGEGIEYERQLGAVAREYGIRVMGPNTNENAFESLPLPAEHRGGLIGLITHSGHNGRPIVQGTVIGAGFSRWIPTGNEVDLEAAHFLRYFAADERTRVIAGYIEGFKSVPRLRAALQAANDADKPVVMLKIGATQRGAATAVSHTGHLAGSDAVIDGLFRQHGVTRVGDLDELLETANLFAKLPHGAGPRVALYSISGGSGTLMAEVADSFDTPMPPLSAQTQSALHELLPKYLTVQNPVDNGGQFVVSAAPAERLKVLDLIAADPNVDVIVVGLTGALGVLTDNFAADLHRWAPTAPKPVIATWNSNKTDEAGFQSLVASGVPIFRSFRNCFAALQSYRAHQNKRARFRRRVMPTAASGKLAAWQCPAGVVPAAQASALLQSAGVTLAQEVTVDSPTAASAAAARCGGRVAMKLMSPAFPHKSDVGLVRVDVAAADVGHVYEELVARARALDPHCRIEGVLVQEQMGRGVEMIVGLTQHGDGDIALTLGAGGIYAEILRDVAVRPLPLDEQDVREMLSELKISALLRGARGAAAANVDALVELALRVASFGQATANQLAELDLNPVIVTPERAVAVDVLLVAR